MVYANEIENYQLQTYEIIDVDWGGLRRLSSKGGVGKNLYRRIEICL